MGLLTAAVRLQDNAVGATILWRIASGFVLSVPLNAVDERDEMVSSWVQSPLFACVVMRLCERQVAWQASGTNPCPDVTIPLFALAGRYAASDGRVVSAVSGSDQLTVWKRRVRSLAWHAGANCGSRRIIFCLIVRTMQRCMGVMWPVVSSLVVRWAMQVVEYMCHSDREWLTCVTYRDGSVCSTDLVLSIADSSGRGHALEQCLRLWTFGMGAETTSAHTAEIDRVVKGVIMRLVGRWLMGRRALPHAQSSLMKTLQNRSVNEQRAGVEMLEAYTFVHELSRVRRVAVAGGSNGNAPRVV